MRGRQGCAWFVAGLLGAIAGSGCSTEGEAAHLDTSPLGIGSCDPPAADGGWRNDFLAQQYGRFNVVLNARALGENGAPIDAVIGLGNRPADTFSDLAAIVRFNPDGFIDARDGGVYRSVAPYPYRADGSERYRMSIEVDLATKRYDVWMATDNVAGSERYLAQGFAFRTEQSALSRADNLARFVDSPTGALEVCDAFIGSRTCLDSFSGQGWKSEPIEPMTDTFTVETEIAAYPMTTDAVVGLSHGVPHAFTDLGPIVRVNPDGTFDARDGSVYRADTVITRDPNNSYDVSMTVDVVRRHYTVWVHARYAGSWMLLANDYAFRTEQANVTMLDTLGAFVDSPQSGFSACDVLVRY